MENIDVKKVIGGKRIQLGLDDNACQVADWF